MFHKSLQVFIPEPLIGRHPGPYGAELRRDEAIAAFSTMPLLGHEAGIEQAAEVLRNGWAAHLEMSRKRVDGAVGLDEQIQHPASRRMADCPKDRLLVIGSPHHGVIMRKQQLTKQ